MQCFCFVWDTAPGDERRAQHRLRAGKGIRGPRYPFWRDCGLHANAIRRHCDHPPVAQQMLGWCLHGGVHNRVVVDGAGDLLIALAHQLHRFRQPRHVLLLRISHEQVSVAFTRPHTPHYAFLVLTKELAQPPPLFCLETRFKTVNLIRVVVDSKVAVHRDDEVASLPDAERS